MKKKYIFGTKGFAKEVEFIIYENFGSLADVVFVAEDSSEDLGTQINGRSVISEKDFFNINEDIECFIAVGSPNIKQKIYSKLKNKNNISFPNLIHKSVVLDERFVKLGFGNILCSHVSVTTNIVIGNFVHINLNCTLGHDSRIEDFVTCSPGCNISGNVNIQNLAYLGTNCIIIENKKIASNVIIGAGAVVVKDLLESGTYVGMPCKKIK
jgi:sugar O-acyltransferase (sialic acid O-acetyltransferase NeuD family)